MPDYTSICRRVNKISIKIKKTLISYKDKEVVISLDSSGAKVTNRGEWMRQKCKQTQMEHTTPMIISKSKNLIVKKV